MTIHISRNAKERRGEVVYRDKHCIPKSACGPRFGLKLLCSQHQRHCKDPKYGDHHIMVNNAASCCSYFDD